MARKSNERIRLEQALEIARLTQGSFGKPQGEQSQSLWFWDRESLALREQPMCSGLMHRLGNMPIVRDVRPGIEKQTDERQQRANAGHCGTCGDDIA
jgi:hypothetical protein